MNRILASHSPGKIQSKLRPRGDSAEERRKLLFTRLLRLLSLARDPRLVENQTAEIHGSSSMIGRTTLATADHWPRRPPPARQGGWWKLAKAHAHAALTLRSRSACTAPIQFQRSALCPREPSIVELAAPFRPICRVQREAPRPAGGRHRMHTIQRLRAIRPTKAPESRRAVNAAVVFHAATSRSSSGMAELRWIFVSR
jgi:hypothetical protein